MWKYCRDLSALKLGNKAIPGTLISYLWDLSLDFLPLWLSVSWLEPRLLQMLDLKDLNLVVSFEDLETIVFLFSLGGVSSVEDDLKLEDSGVSLAS